MAQSPFDASHGSVLVQIGLNLIAAESTTKKEKMTSISGWSIYMDTLVTGQSMV
jgi:hypothetical protein